MPNEEKTKSLDGDHDYLNQHIRVRTKDRSPHAIANTIIHEALHGLFFFAGLHEVPRNSKNMEEQIVNGFANGLSQLMRDNPEAMRRVLKMATSK
jgi:hypothetical protein